MFLLLVKNLKYENLYCEIYKFVKHKHIIFLINN